jgi:hypothetical protein
MKLRIQAFPVWLWIFIFLLGGAMGCATTGNEDEEVYSDQPWNQPQSWEGVIPMPNMDGRR